MTADSVLSALVEVKGAREAIRAAESVQGALREARNEAVLATNAVNRFGRTRGIAVLDVDSAKARAQVKAAENDLVALGGGLRRAGNDVDRLGSNFDGLHKSVSKTDTLIDRNVGTFGRLSQSIRGTSNAASSMRGNLGPLSGGLGVVAAGALLLGTALLSIAGPAIAVTAALGPLVGLAAGAAGGLVVAAQGFGVFKLATSGVGAALKEQAANQARVAQGLPALNTEMSRLSPAAQSFTRALLALNPRLAELRQSAGTGFFPGATAGLKAAEGSFGAINKVVGETSLVLGDAARKSGELVGSPAFSKDIQTIGSNNAKVLGTLGEALRHIISAFRHVLVAAGPLTQWLADVANKWALNAAEAAKAGRETGKLAAFFEKTRETAQRLGSILSSLAGGLFGIGKVGAESGRDILASIDRAAKRFDEWANSVKGQNSIREFFEKTKEIAGALLPALANLAAGFAFLALKLLPVTTALQLLGPYADEAIIAFVAYKIAITAAGVASKAWALAAGASALATGGLTGAFWALNAALVANPIGLVVAGLAALVAGLIVAYKKSETFRDIVNGVWDAIKTAATAFANFFTSTIPGAFMKVFDGITGFFRGLPDGIADAIKSVPGVLGAVGSWILDKIVGGFKAVTGLLGTVGTWLKERFSDFIHNSIEGWKVIGGWVLNRIVDGFKVITGLLGTVGGWLKNRFEEFIHNSVEGWKVIGSWVLNRIVEGFKAVTEALGTVGGWLKNRVVELVHLAVDGFTGLGGWVLNRIVDGLKTLTDGLKSVGGWLKNRIGDALDTVKDGFLDVGGNIMGWIVDGLKGGANLLVDFVNKIIGVINKIPGVDIGKIKGFAEGGKHAKGVTGGGPNGNGQLAFARGGFFGATGGYMDRPVALGGEESPTHAEWVLPENPAYRGRALGLWAAAGQALGAPGFAEGGVVSAFKSAINQTNASAKPSLALFEAGIVESGLRNLPYGDRDSLGALQLRAGIHGRELAMSPLGSALAFLTRGFTGAGGAISLSNSGRTAGQVAQAVQGSAFPDRYDQVRGQAQGFLGGGGILGAIGGAISSVGGVLGDLLSKGAGFLLDKLPGVGDLPDFLKGTGKYVLGKAGGFIKDKVSSLIGLAGGGGAVGGGVTGSVQGAMALARQMGLQITSTTGGQHAKNSWHYKGRAADVAGSAGQMAAFFNASLERYGKNLLELFYDPLGAIKNGQRIGAIGGHADHVHIALAKGGVYGGGLLGSYAGGTDYVPQTGPYLLHRGESVAPAAQTGDDGGRGNVIVKGDLIVRTDQQASLLADRLSFRLKYS